MPDFLVFQLKGTFASWGDIAVGEQRTTLQVPTKSAILGLIAAAKGIDRENESAHLDLQKQVLFAVEVVKDGDYLTDYHTTQVPSQTAIKNKKIESRKQEIEVGDLGTILSTRSYRISPQYTIVLEAKKEVLEGIQQALLYPIYAPCLGRKSCPLEEPMNPQLYEVDSLQEALKVYSRGAEIIGNCFWESKMTSSGTYLSQISLYSGIRSRKRWAFSEMVMMSSVKMEGK